MDDYNGLGLGLGNLAKVSRAVSRSISAENFTGEKGKGGMATDGTGAEAARDLGQGWKVSPSINLPANSTTTIANIKGPGVIQHMWMTCYPDRWRDTIIRIYWDDEPTPSVEVPFGDFFANGWCEPCPVNSLPIAVNPAGGMNAYWEMPFRKSAKVTIENMSDEDYPLYYQINYALMAIPEDMAYFHAQWRRSHPLKYKEVHTIIDGIQGIGHYVGTYIAWGVNHNGWWGEGEVKFYMDGDDTFATIVGTGTEDYFGGAWNFEHPKGQYGAYSTPFLGLPQIIQPDGLYKSQQRFGMYRWDIMDPIRFQEDLKVTIQALGWRADGRYLPRQDDIASVAYWYQLEPHQPFPKFATKDELEIT